MKSKSIAITDERGEFLDVVDAELPIYSLAKPFIASAVLSTGIDIQSPISSWFDKDLVPRGCDISVEQLLNHTSGLRDYGGLTEYNEAISSGGPPWSDDVFADHTLRKPLLFEPGESWSYSNPGYWLLSQIVQRETGLTLDRVIAHLIAEPLALSSTRVVYGQFAETLPWYPAGWVWHGLLVSTARDVVRFMNSTLVTPLLGKLTKVPVEHPLWIDPHYGYGLMVEPGVRYGHNGGGPHYSASCFHFIEERLTGCVLMEAHQEGEAMKVLLDEIARYQ